MQRGLAPARPWYMHWPCHDIRHVCHNDAEVLSLVHAQVRWWDGEVNTFELLKYTPFLAHTPKERYMFTSVKASHRQKQDGHVVYEYMRDWQELRLDSNSQRVSQPRVRNANEWKGVRVTIPAKADWFDGGLCCHSAYERADDKDVVQLVLVKC